MPTRETAFPGAPCWVDLMTSDIEVSRDFYTEVLGWEAQERNAEFGGYFQFFKDGHPVAGCMSATPDSPVQNVWSTHLCTQNVEKTLAAAVDAGGQVAMPAMTVGTLGIMSMIVDPSGAAIGAWEPKDFQGFGLLFADGAPCWHELHTNNYDAAVPFYRDVFGWTLDTVSDTPEFRYSTLEHDGRFWAGILDAANSGTAEPVSNWVVYFGAEPDEAVDKVVKLGGQVLEAPVDTPHGRMARVMDPNGTQFKIMRGNEEMPDSF